MLIQTDKYNKINSKIGRVTKLIKGRDANVQAANVEHMNNDKKVTIARPINKLYPVELNNNEAEVKLKFVDEKDIHPVKPFSVDEVNWGSVEKRHLKYFSSHVTLISLYIF